ncbi:MAG TPA: aminotransferase class I/II-fold pyridoxal phosphate-dependent enzyme [Longimicrobiales bacterium]|nr:aminotransferase class I/II-fold pyridoxal phosphate-dependent enzyme [Longimicrobiales bacterium]
MQKNEFRPFAMERWQSIYENQVEYNLSESGVHPLTLGELRALSGAADFDQTLLGYGQSNGSELLRSRIAALYPKCATDSIVVTNGSAEANFIALWVLTRPDDEVVIIVPTYMQLHGLAQNFGVKVREVWLREEAGWQIDEAELTAAVTERTRLIVVTNPSNPTGAIMHPDLRNAVVRAADRVGCWILADEVYSGAEHRGPETPSFFGEYQRVIATGSLSKAYGLPGVRIGWAVAPPEMAALLWARKDYMTISPGELTDHVAATALAPQVRPRILQRTRSMVQEGWDITRAWLDVNGVFTYHAPVAGAIAYVRYDLPVESAALAELLRAEYGVLVVPGVHFGMGRYLRLGFGPPPAQLRAALARVSSALNRLR